MHTKPERNPMRKLALPDEILLKIEKPARYIGGEVNSVTKDPDKVDIRFAMCFPDVYEIGMSHLGIQILYDMFNRREDVWCERVYSPWVDLHKIMKEQQIPLFALESQEPVRKFDFLGITLQYEMCYTNVLQILDLSQIPLHSADRTWEDPIVIGGGPCAYNPEPLADFFDLFYIGEGETVYDQLMDTYRRCRQEGKSRLEFLEYAAGIEGIYVPRLYEPSYHEDGTLADFHPVSLHAPAKVKKQAVMEMNEVVYPMSPVVPFIKATQDRVVLEIMRGCIRGCRFCQAGMIYRPTRERSVDTLKQYAKAMLDNTGHEEICLSSLSSSDYSGLQELVTFLIEEYQGKFIIYSLGNFCFGANRNPPDKDCMIFQQTFTFVDGVKQEDAQIRVIPCSVSSTPSRNDYKPTPAQGEESQRILDRINEFSLEMGVRLDSEGYLAD